MRDAGQRRNEIWISNRATYWTVAPLDMLVAAPLVGRLLLGATPLGKLLQGVVLGMYLGNGLRDWRDRQGIRRIDFRREFGADVGHMRAMPRESREAEVQTLARRLNDEIVLERIPRRELAVEVDQALTRYIAGITGQHVRTSAAVRDFSLVGLAFPFAVGACDLLTGDVTIFRDTGLLEAHVLAHEFSHRKGYWKELHAQVLGYLSLVSSGELVLQQSALLERRNLRVLAGDDRATFERLVRSSALRSELKAVLLTLWPSSTGIERQLDTGLRRLYHLRMRLTGQAGISDYDLGFTNFLYTFETTASARQIAPAAGTLSPSGFRVPSLGSGSRPPVSIRARWASACAVVGRRTQRSKVLRSASVIVNGGIGRPVRMKVHTNLRLTRLNGLRPAEDRHKQAVRVT